MSTTSSSAAGNPTPKAPVSPFQNFVVQYGGGERIFTEGDLGTTMYIVQSGRVRLFRMSGGNKRVLGTMEKGDFFGEMSILEGLPRTTCAEAEEDAELIEINSMTFDKMIKGNIEIAIRMLRKLSIRLRETERRVEELQSPPGSAGAAAAAAVAPAAPIVVEPPAPAVEESPAVPGFSPVPEAAAGSAPARPNPALGGACRLESIEDTSVFEFAGDETLIGRYDPVTDLKPDVDLTAADIKRSVSRRHARIVRQGGGYFISEEVGALNGTFVNGTKLETGRSHAIQDGDQVSLGMVKLVFRC